MWRRVCNHVKDRTMAALTDQTELRHTVDMSEGMAKYGWTAYDTREGGRQIIEDVGNKINITTEFTKDHEGQSADTWGLRIKGIPRSGAPTDLKTTVVFYVGMEAMESCPGCNLEAREQLGPGEDKSVKAVNFNIAHPRLGTAGIHISASISEEGRSEGTVVKTLNVSDDKLLQAKCELQPKNFAFILCAMDLILLLT